MVGFGSGTCGQAERQESANAQKMAEKLRRYIAVIVIIPLRGSKSSVTGLHCFPIHNKAVAVLHQVVHNVNAEHHMLLIPLPDPTGLRTMLDRFRPGQTLISSMPVGVFRLLNLAKKAKQR